eukprot:4420784-Prymnesium_polylepis.1
MDDLRRISPWSARCGFRLLHCPRRLVSVYRRLPIRRCVPTARRLALRVGIEAQLAEPYAAEPRAPPRQLCVRRARADGHDAALEHRVAPRPPRQVQ